MRRVNDLDIDIRTINPGRPAGDPPVHVPEEVFIPSKPVGPAPVPTPEKPTETKRPAKTKHG